MTNDEMSGNAHQHEPKGDIVTARERWAERTMTAKQRWAGREGWMQRNLNSALDHWLNETIDVARPLSVVWAVCELRWPDREWHPELDPEVMEQDDPPTRLGDMVDDAGTTASDLRTLEKVKAARPKVTAAE